MRMKALSMMAGFRFVPDGNEMRSFMARVRM